MAAIQLDRKIKSAVSSWRKDYEGATPVTKRLLEFWFKEDHCLKDGAEFRYWKAQQEAIEALIYVYEVQRYHSLYQLSRNLGVSLTFDPTTDNWPKYCFKMATGSGKTYVMALAMVWQYFNRFFKTDNKCRYTSKFLLIAPNLIVLDRLNEDFEDNSIFRRLPFIPPEWDADFDFQLIYQSQVTPEHTLGTLYLTNIQQLYEDPVEEPPNAVHEALGRYVAKGQPLSRLDLKQALAAHSDLLVLNDEAHHVHSEDLEWAKAISSLHESSRGRKSDGLVAQLDFSATPYIGSGDTKRFFPHIIYDYPLGAAVRDQVVKRPKIGEIEHATEPVTRDYVRKNQLQIDTGVQVFRQFQKDLAKSGKKPVLFIMTDETGNADKVGRYLEGTPHHLKTLVIHTDKAGVITKKGLDEAREAARSIDTNQYQAIVSVMMLKEGWDVKNVCVIVPLRSYESMLLAEQTLGRGLRRMSPVLAGWEEKLIVIEHPRFRDLWNAEIREEELDIEITEARRVYEPSNVIRIDPAKAKKFDLAIPVLAGGITRDVRRVADLDIKKLPRAALKFEDIKLPKVMYRQKDLLTQETELEQELSFDYTDRYDVYLQAITKAILTKCGVSAQFAEVLPKVREYIEKYLFDQRIDMDDPEVVKKLNFIPVRAKIRDVFVEAILRLQVVEEPFQLTETFKVSGWNEGLAFQTSEPVYLAKKTAFATGEREGLPYPKQSEYEKHFMRYLDGQKEVLAYTKILSRMPPRIPYHDAEGFLRHYTPDFAVRTKSSMYLIETKGKGWDDQQTVSAKVGAALTWCGAVGKMAKQRWAFVKILQSDFELYSELPFGQLIQAVSKGTPQSPAPVASRW